MTPTELLAAYLTGLRDFRDSDLSGSDLRGATRDDRKLLSSGSIGRAPSSGRTVTWLVYEDGEPEIMAGCFDGTPAELRKAARKTHADNPAALDWYLRVASWIARDSRDVQARAAETRRAA